MVGMNYDPRAKQIGAKFLKYKHHRKKFMFSYCIVLLSFIQGFTRIVDGVKDFIPSFSQYHTK